MNQAIEQRFRSGTSSSKKPRTAMENGGELVSPNAELHEHAVHVASRRGDYIVGWIEGWIKRKTWLLPEPEQAANPMTYKRLPNHYL